MKMTENEAKSYAKGRLEELLRSRGIETRRPFRCLVPGHADKNASMSYKNGRVKCFGCGFSGDIFDIVAMEENLSGRDVFRRVYDMLGIETEVSERFRGVKKASAVHAEKAAPVKATEQEDLSGYLAECAARVGETDYYAGRGLSDEVISRFRLGYDGTFTRSTGRRAWKAAIIPSGAGGYIARNTDPQADDRHRYRKAGQAVIFNGDTLFEDSELPVWIVEGEIDALSVETLGHSAAALGSVANADKLIRMLENRRCTRRIIIAMDADDAGRRCAAKLGEALSLLKLEYMEANPFGGKKDANEALLSDREAFSAALAEAEEAFDTVKRSEDIAAADEYEQKFSAAAHLDAFLGELAAANTRCIPTGFRKLDAALGGGAYAGLIFIGAVSSLGKTTFALQLADNVAASGEDVLIFSLEMSRYELISRSVSRETLRLAMEEKKPSTLAKSSRDITVAERYSLYTDEELILIDRAISRYRETCAANVFIVEGQGDIGVMKMRQMLENHIARRKKTPVVIVDYLQIIAAPAERLNEKQEIDRNVLELRRMARDMRTPVIAISSFSRANYNQSANISAYKASGLIEYSADVLMALQPAGIGTAGFDLQKALLENPRSIEVKVLKNRNGVTGASIDFRYYPMYNYFIEE